MNTNDEEARPMRTVSKKAPNSGKQPKYLKPEEREALCIKLREWGQQGATIAEVCTLARIGRETWYNRVREFPELLVALNEGRSANNEEIKGALLKRALGGKHVLVKRFYKTTPINGSGDLTDPDNYTRILTGEEHSEIYHAPDLNAINVWLKNFKEGWSENPNRDQIEEKYLELKEKETKNKF